jgi:hypothetical protein
MSAPRTREARPALDELINRLVDSASLTGATLSRPVSAEQDAVRRITVDPVELRSGARWRVRRHYVTKATDENVDSETLVELLRRSIGGEFRQALLRETVADWQVLAGGRAPRVLRRPATRPQQRAAHDRRKRHLLSDGEPVPYLVALGVQTPDGRVRAQRRDKFRQVNRFVELVDDVVSSLPDGSLHIVDYGSATAPGAPT